MVLRDCFFVSLTVFKSFIFPFRFLAVPCGATETSLLLYVRKFGAPRPSDAFALTKHRTRRMFRHFLGSHGSLASTLGFDFTFPEGLVCGSHHARQLSHVNLLDTLKSLEGEQVWSGSC